MNFTDTHAHLYLNQFDTDLDNVIHRAHEEQVKTIILPNIDSKTILPLHSLADKHPKTCIPLMGLHPTHVKENYREELDKILKQFEKFSYKGIGEIGIDLYWDKTRLKDQIYVFKQHLLLALEKKLPVVIHARESFDEIMEILSLKQYEGIRGIFHAFTGHPRLAEQIISMGFKLGFGGILTYKNSGLEEVVKVIDIEDIVLETDSPYLAPVPFRGKRNESGYIKFIAQKVADIKGLPVEKVAEITTKNASEVFGIFE